MEDVMAQSGFEDRPAEPPASGDAAAKISGQRARQGQNIKGMLVVLVVGIVLVAAAYGVMLALQAEPASVTDASRDEAAASAPVQQPPPEGQQETASSPN
jgi:hypothetical protein